MVPAIVEAAVVRALGSLWLDLHLVCFPLSLVVLLGVILCVFVQWGGVRSIRRNLIPRMALGLLLEFLMFTDVHVLSSWLWSLFGGECALALLLAAEMQAHWCYV